ncbi:FapA family protein [Reinekea sp.]|jgi:uncharacterized protein (DUF342 family)|uniref:DUF342 domain-containing protein n=1 Tax=Reinekea sp. TaxID=1970455 RepID=UPI002A7EBE1D|nr:FapA family protein [Reinekea sp.]
MTKTSESPPIRYVACTLEVNNDAGIVIANLVSAQDPSEFTQLILKEQLSLAGVLHWSQDESASNELVNKFNRALPCQIIIAHKVDGTFQIILAPDSMKAFVEIKPAQGGVAVALENLIVELAENQVDLKCIDHAGLNDVIAALTPSKVLVAVGKHPKPGLDTRFRVLVSEHNLEELEEDEHGIVDYLAGKVYVTVLADSPIMERSPPQDGQGGINIFGQPIPAPSGKEIAFAKKMPGTYFASDNPDLLMAEVSGHPVFFQDGARVDKTLEFDNVDLTSGHVKFDGSVFVKGDVRPDMKIEVTGDVFIKGAVERALVTAGNNITVAGGVLGDTPSGAPERGLASFECFLDAGGSVEAKFINLASVTAGRDIIVKEYSFNSLLVAEAQVTLGQNGGKGRLVGGQARAGHSVIAKILGSQAYNATEILVGASALDFELLKKLKFIRDQRISQARQLRELLVNIKAKNHQEKLGELDIDRAKIIHQTLLRLQTDLHEIDRRMKQINLARCDEGEPNVSATSSCFPNCFITINGATKQTHNEHKSISYIKKNAEITTRK